MQIKTPSQVLDYVLEIYKGYSEEHRASTQPFHLERAISNISNYQYNPDDIIVREPLIEHTGSLPIVATAIYPYINNEAVNIGEALVMLAIHDIGELGVGDEMTFTKKIESADEEQKHALNNLNPIYHEPYLDIENQTSVSAKYAKAIDKITPDIVDLLTPAEISVIRYKHFTGKEAKEIVPLIKEFKHPYMLWNDFMVEIHLELLQRLDEKLKPFY